MGVEIYRYLVGKSHRDICNKRTRTRGQEDGYALASALPLDPAAQRDALCQEFASSQALTSRHLDDSTIELAMLQAFDCGSTDGKVELGSLFKAERAKLLQFFTGKSGTSRRCLDRSSKCDGSGGSNSLW
jgi:hypothetical protein